MDVREKTYEFLVDRVSYKDKPKPQGDELGLIRSRLAKPEARIRVGVEELGEFVKTGYTIMPGVCEGGTKASNWVSQQLVFLDFDNDKKMLKRGYWPISMTSALDRARWCGIPPFFIYETFSHSPTPCENRFRMIFDLDEPVRDAREIEAVFNDLRRIFPEADPSSFDRVHMFLSPGKGVQSVWISRP